MIQSRFFHSSLQEVQLNVKEIYSLQGELRESIVNKSKRTIRFDKEIIEDVALSPTSVPTTFAAAQGPSTSFSTPPQGEIGANPVAIEVPPNEQGMLNPAQPLINALSTPVKGSGFKTLNTKNSNLQSRTLPSWVVFLSLAIFALFVMIFFIL